MYEKLYFVDCISINVENYTQKSFLRFISCGLILSVLWCYVILCRNWKYGILLNSILNNNLYYHYINSIHCLSVIFIELEWSMCCLVKLIGDTAKLFRITFNLANKKTFTTKIISWTLLVSSIGKHAIKTTKLKCSGNKIKMYMILSKYWFYPSEVWCSCTGKCNC